ncbi:hypothetical protein [Streptomyces sp. cg35]
MGAGVVLLLERWLAQDSWGAAAEQTAWWAGAMMLVVGVAWWRVNRR